MSRLQSFVILHLPIGRKMISVVCGSIRYAPDTATFGQLSACECLSNNVICNVGDIDQPFEQTKRMQDRRINADANIGVALLNPLQRGPGCEGTICNDRHRQATPTAGILDVRAKFAQCPSYGGRGIMRCGHL